MTLRQMDIHSCDGTVALLPGGCCWRATRWKTPSTYVDEPERLTIHLEGLAEMAAGRSPASAETWRGRGDRGGGYQPDLITVTHRYVGASSRPHRCDARRTRSAPLRAEDFASGAISYFAPYEAVHQKNLAAVQSAS